MNKWRGSCRRYHGSSNSSGLQNYVRRGELREAVTAFQQLTHPTPFACNLLISAYARHGHLGDAKRLFDETKGRDSVSWNSLINGFSKAGHVEKSRQVFEKMPEWNLISWNTLICTYARKGHLQEATSLLAGLGEYGSVLSWNSLLLGYALVEQHLEAIHLFQKMLLAGVHPNGGTFVSLLEACSSPEALGNGKLLHALVTEAGFDSLPEVGGALIKMYGRCDETSLEEAASVFWRIKSPGVIIWTSIITVYSKARLGDDSLTLFRLMNLEGVRPDRVTFISVLDSCEVFLAGRWINSLVAESGIHLDTVLGTALVNMYGKCGAVSESREVFNSLSEKNIYTWSAMFNAYTRNRLTSVAVQLFKHMDLDGCQPTNVTFSTLLSGETSPAELKLIHACIEEESLDSDVQVAEALINSYSRLGLVKNAESVFERSPSPSLRSAMVRAYVDNRLMHLAEEMLPHQGDVSSVKSVMGGYLQQSRFKEVMEVFAESILEGVRPHKFMYITALGASGGLKDVRLVKLLDEEVTSLYSDVMVASALVFAYGKCGSVNDSRLVFHATSIRKNLVTWNSMLVTLSSNGLLAEAEGLLYRMPERDTFTWNTMLTAYSLHGRLEDARRVFDVSEKKTVVSWTSMMRAYVKNGCPKTAVELLAEMDSEGVEANVITLLTAFEACAESLSLPQGRDVHVNCSFDEESIASAGIVHMYGKCKRLELAREVFSRQRLLSSSSRELWTSMIGALSGNGQNTEALKLFSCMDLEGVTPDSLTLVNVFTACANTGHRSVLSSIWSETEVALVLAQEEEEDEYVGLTLLNMLTKCGGTVEETERLFQLLEKKLTAKHVQHRKVLWSSLISAYSRAGLPVLALLTFRNMLVEGVFPDTVTFVHVLSACSHAGLLAEGVEQFQSMQEEFNLSPELDHFVCMVDLVSRSGRLAEAEEIIHTMPVYPSSLCWSTLLAACKTQGDLEHARCAANSSSDVSDFLLLSHTLIMGTVSW